MLDMTYSPGPSNRDVETEMSRLIAYEPSPVTASAAYHLSVGGARVRASLALEAAAAMNLSAKAAIACAAASELLHNASLVHDDLSDGDVTRRGAATVWSRFGRDMAISTGDLLISAAYFAIANHPKPAPALRVVHHATAVTISGQTADCCTENPTPAEWAAIAGNKSGPLLALPVQLVLIAADAGGRDIAGRAGRALAVAYQTVDDFADRDTDLAHGTMNICLSLERTGCTPAAARGRAYQTASTALRTARDEARALPGNIGASFSCLADRLEAQLKEIANAT